MHSVYLNIYLIEEREIVSGNKVVAPYETSLHLF